MLSLGLFATEVTRVAREVGTKGNMGVTGKASFEIHCGLFLRVLQLESRTWKALGRYDFVCAECSEPNCLQEISGAVNTMALYVFLCKEMTISDSKFIMAGT